MYNVNQLRMALLLPLLLGTLIACSSEETISTAGSNFAPQDEAGLHLRAVSSKPWLVTGGDVLVYFPKDRLVFTGDVAFSGPSYLGDGYVDEWPQTLENLKALDFDIFVPGHGPAITDLERIDIVQEFYRDLWDKAEKLHAAGVDIETAAKTIDLTNHKAIPVLQVGTSLTTIQRIYHRLKNPDS